MNLFDDSPEIRKAWCLANNARNDLLLKQMKEEFSLLHRENIPKPVLRERPMRAIRQPQLRKSGRFSYKVG